MKKKLIKLSMFVLLSFTTSTIFAQTVVAQSMSVAEIEKKLTDNTKLWVWYDPKAAMDAVATKSQTYQFLANHKVNIIANGKNSTSDWKVTSTEATSLVAASTSIKIGTINYKLGFGSDKTYTELMMLTGVKPAAATTSYFYSRLVPIR